MAQNQPRFRRAVINQCLTSKLVDRLPGPALRFSPGYHITGLRPFGGLPRRCNRAITWRA